MTTTIQDNRPNTPAVNAAGKIRMTPAMREGLDALQREYDAFREASFQTLALISDRRIDSK